MSKIHTNILKEEKELALSLLRIPINFFADSKDSDKKVNIETKSKSDNPNVTTTSSPSSKPDIEVTLGKNGSEHINVSKNVELDFAASVTSSTISEDISQSSTQSEHQSSQDDTSQPEAIASATTSKNSETPHKKSSEPQPQASQENFSTSNSTPDKYNKIPTKTPHLQQSDEDVGEDNVESSTPSEKRKTSEERSHNKRSSNKDSSDQEVKKKKNEQERSKNDKKSDSKKTQNDNNKKPDTPKSQPAQNPKADELKKKYGNKKPSTQGPKKLKPGNGKDKLGDKLAKNPAAKKAMGKFNKAQKIKETAQTAKEAIKDMDQGKMQEVAGETAVQVAKKIPGPVGAAVTVADTIAGDTKIGKKVKKGIGWCCMLGCVFLVAIILMPIVFIMQIFTGATNNNDYGDIVNELSAEDSDRLEQAGLENSLQQYTNDTIHIGLSASNSIENVLQDYLDNRYYYTEKQAAEYNTKYASLIELGLLFEVAAGDLTNFGMTFEVIKENYTVDNLKAPTSAPKRIKKVDGEEIVYTTFNPKGIHQALFEDVLTNMDGLINRFDGQVSKEWFNELGRINANGTPLNTDSILDKKFDVYIEDLDETRQLSLRDLFIETSTTSYDTEYYASLVKTTLTKYSIKNAEIIEQYDELVERLAMLELMTYMLAYQKYYNQLINFVNAYDKYDNISMFDPRTPDGEEFWAQFLTFSNVEHYIALSGLTDHSLTYEIAVASINTSTNPIDVDLIDKKSNHFVGIRKFENWYATYHFTPQVPYVDGSYQYIISNPPPKINQTNIQNYLFDKYNIGFGLFNNDPSIDNDPTLTDEDKAKLKALKNQNAFFALFEAATGIKMSVQDDNGQPQSPIYVIDTNGISRDRYFPVSNTTQARVTHGYNQLYSDETVATFGLSHNNHTGIDYAVPVGTTIVASSSGTAYVSRGNTGYGNYVKILHDDGYSSIYAHGNGTFFINNGARVVSGQPIMQSGNSGNSTGPHLHFEVRKPSGTTVNPTSYIYGNA